jgi:hypothetical protein
MVSGEWQDIFYLAQLEYEGPIILSYFCASIHYFAQKWNPLSQRVPSQFKFLYEFESKSATLIDVETNL